jgi:hypothetical protein
LQFHHRPFTEDFVRLTGILYFRHPDKKNTSMQSKEFVIRMLRSLDHPDVAQQFASEQCAVLKLFDVTGITSAKQAWQSDPNTYMFIAEEASTGQMVAGMRLDMESDFKSIPMSEALTKVSDEFRDLVDNLKPLGLAEGCGLWVKEGYAGLGLPSILVRACVSASTRLGVNYLFSFPHQHTRPMMSRYGFTTVDVIGDNGAFSYPDNRYRSTVVELNARTLHTTPKVERDRIFSLRGNPEMEVKEGELLLQYCLN